MTLSKNDTQGTQSNKGVCICGLKDDVNNVRSLQRSHGRTRTKDTANQRLVVELFLALQVGQLAIIELNADATSIQTDRQTDSSRSGAALLPKKLVRGSSVARSVAHLGALVSISA